MMHPIIARIISPIYIFFGPYLSKRMARGIYWAAPAKKKYLLKNQSQLHLVKMLVLIPGLILHSYFEGRKIINSPLQMVI